MTVGHGVHLRAGTRCAYRAYRNRVGGPPTRLTVGRQIHLRASTRCAWQPIAQKAAAAKCSGCGLFTHLEDQQLVCHPRDLFILCESVTPLVHDLARFGCSVFICHLEEIAILFFAFCADDLTDDIFLSFS